MSRISLHQFAHEKERNGTPLAWPGVNGFPFAGKQVPDLIGNQADELPMRLVFRSGTFDTWDAEAKKAYDDVQNHIGSNVWLPKHRTERWLDKGLQIYLEWYEVYAEPPQGPKHGRFS